jgi:hypothetical protein
MSSDSTDSGIGLGAVIAAIVSYTTNHSILWALVHGFLGWFYLIYRICGCGGS